eukprot:s2034_g5.t1
MGASLGQGLGHLEANDLHSGDLGPQEPWPHSFPLDTPCSFEAAALPGRCLRPREATAAGRSFSFWVAEEGDGATDFVLEMGLLGEGLSIRSLQRPLHYVRVQSEHFILSPYDGTQRFRSDATFELRRGELDGAAASGDACDWVCLMLAKRPGLYAHVEKEGQIAAKPYCYLGREAFHFKLLQRGGLPCASLVWDVSEPSMGLCSSTAPTSGVGPSVASAKEDLKLKFLPTFSLPAYDSYDLHRLALPAAPAKSEQRKTAENCAEDCAERGASEVSLALGKLREKRQSYEVRWVKSNWMDRGDGITLAFCAQAGWAALVSGALPSEPCMRKKKLPKAEARYEAELRRRIFAAAKGAGRAAWQEALAALRLHLPLAPQLLPLGATVNGCAKAAQWRWAQELFGVLETARLQHSLVVCNSVLTACRARHGTAQRWPRGLRLLTAARHMSLRPDVVSHSTTLLGCENWPWALRLLPEASQISFNSALSALRSAYGWACASQLLQQMQQSSHLPDVFAFTTAIGFESDSDRAWRQAIETLLQMEERGVTPNSATLNSVIETCERSCQWPLALWLLHARHLPRATAVTYSAAMMACSQGSHWNLALQLLEEMCEVALQVDLVAFGSGLAAAELGKRWRTGLHILQQLFLTEVPPSAVVYGSAVGCCEWAWALQLLGHMELSHGLRPDLVTMTSALLSLAAAAQWQRAMELLSFDGGAVNFLSFYAVLRACEDRHEHLQVLRLFPSIQDITMETFRPKRGRVAAG